MGFAVEEGGPSACKNKQIAFSFFSFSHSQPRGVDKVAARKRNPVIQLWPHNQHNTIYLINSWINFLAVFWGRKVYSGKLGKEGHTLR